MGLLKNPMIVSMVLGLVWSATGLAVPGPVNEFLTLLGAAATPGALFAIGASLATQVGRTGGGRGLAQSSASWSCTRRPSRSRPAGCSRCRAAGAGVMIAAAALPVAGNVFILAQHYGVAPQRVSTSILISTAVSILTVTGVIALGHRQPEGGHAMKTISENRAFGGVQGVYTHASHACACDMTFGLFLPDEAERRAGAAAVVSCRA